MSNPSQLSPAWEGIVCQLAGEVRHAAAVASRTVGYGWGLAMTVPLFDGEAVKHFHCWSFPYPLTVSDELCRVNLDGLGPVPFANAIYSLLCQEIEPFIIGAGKIRTVQGIDGLKVYAVDLRHVPVNVEHVRSCVA